MTIRRYAGYGPRLLVLGAMMVASGPALAQELVWARYGDIDSLDPHRATSTLSMQVWDQIYDTLLAFDDEGKPRANLAKSWEVSDDGLSYTLALEAGVTCHDGTPFDAEDVKFTIDRAFDGAKPSLTKTSWGPIEAVEVIDPLTVKVSMASRFGAFLPFLADSFSSMVCDSNTGDGFGSATRLASKVWFTLDDGQLRGGERDSLFARVRRALG